MSELTNKVQRMLSQAQKFVNEAPLEALGRARLAQSTVAEALEGASQAERGDLEMLAELVRERVQRYEQAFHAWSSEVGARADLFEQHERERLQQPLPTKI